MKSKIKFKLNGQSSIFHKYLAISFVIILSSFLILGCILMSVLTKYWTNNKMETMNKNTVSLATLCTNYIGVTDRNRQEYFFGDLVALRDVLETVSSNIGGDAFIVNANGKISASNKNARYATEGKFIDYDIIRETIENNRYYSETDLNGIFEKPYYVYGMPVYINNTLVCLAFTTADTAEYNYFTSLMLNIFLVSALITFAVAIIAIGLYSYHMVKPLRKIAYAAHKFGNGDFSARVNVKTKDEIGQLADEFNKMAESLSASESTRRSFIANVSHELKTPMTTIAGFIDGILDGTIPYEKQSYYLKIVSDEVRRLSRLVRSMLDLSKIDSGELKLNYKHFDLVSTTVSALVTFEAEIDKKNIEIRGLEDMHSAYIDADMDLIHQVVYNLIENAVKFVNEGGYIEFKVNSLPDRTEFSIINSGHGIEKSDLMHVFDKFYKTDKSRSIDKKGMGLGLYLVKTIIQLHDGNITVSSEVGKYCRFDFYIPNKNPRKPKLEIKPQRLEQKISRQQPFKKEVNTHE